MDSVSLPTTSSISFIMQKKNINPSKLVNVPFSKTQCGVDFYINTGNGKEICGVLTENTTFKTDFFEFFFFHRADGFLLLNSKPIDLHDDMVLLLSPHQRQEWHVDERAWTIPFSSFAKTSCVRLLPTSFLSTACSIAIRPTRHPICQFLRKPSTNT